jgi:hypothetical protein
MRQSGMEIALSEILKVVEEKALQTVVRVSQDAAEEVASKIRKGLIIHINRLSYSPILDH